MNWLGKTLEEIYFEKAGIIKESVPLFTAVCNDVIKNICKERDAQLILVNNEENTNMNGSFQRTNAALAAAVARYMKLPESSIKKGLLDTYWPARLEFVEKNVLLDCAHNPDGIRKMAEFVNSLNYDKLIMLFGVMKDKDYNAMINEFPDYDVLIFTKPKIDRSLDPNELKGVCKNSIVIEDIGTAYEYTKNIANQNDLILICGSCYLAGEFLAWKNKIKTHPIMFVQ